MPAAVFHEVHLRNQRPENLEDQIEACAGAELARDRIGLWGDPVNRPASMPGAKPQVRAGGEGFEPPNRLRDLRFSRPPRSSAPASPHPSVAEGSGVLS
jgi:hypothetical protein